MWALANFREGKEVASCYMGLDGRKVRLGGLEVPLMVRPICRTTDGVRSDELRNTRWEDFETGLQPVTPSSISSGPSRSFVSLLCCLQRSRSEILYNPKLRRLQTRVSAPPAAPTQPASQGRTFQPMSTHAATVQSSADVGSSSSSAPPDLNMEDLDSLLSLVGQQPQTDASVWGGSSAGAGTVECGQYDNVAVDTTMMDSEAHGCGADPVEGAWFDETDTWRGNPRNRDAI